MGLNFSTRRVLLGGGQVIRYLLRDEFSDTRAAGAVDGTAAAPGPGTRAVTDSLGNGLAVTGGAATMTTYVVAATDPSLSYVETFARTSGRVLLGQVSYTSDRIFGWGYVTERINFANSDVVSVATSGNPAVGLMLINTIYDLAIVLRPAGIYVFFKGGTYTTWTLAWFDTHNVDDPVAFRFCTFQTPVGATWRNHSNRIPIALWLPTPVAYDTFTRGDGALGNSETSGPESQAVFPRAWLNRVGTTEIDTNKASASALVGGIAIATVDTGTASVVMEGTCTRAGNEVGLVLRYADADNYIRAVHDGTNCQLIKRVAAAETTVITAAVAIGAGVMRVQANGTAFRLFLNDVAVGAVQAIADAALQTGTEHGVFSTNTGNTQDGFLVFPSGAAGEYAALDDA